jgi:N-acetylmuramoyl-L-alanine amidase
MSRQKLNPPIPLVILLTALLIVAGIAPVVAQVTGDAGTVTSTVAAGITLNVRNGPGLQYPAFTTLAGGQPVTLIGRDSTGAWFQLRLDDNRVGWVSGQFLLNDFLVDDLPLAGAAPEVLPTGAAPGVGGLSQGTVVNAEILNVRSGPGLNFDPFATLALSQTVALEGRDAAGGWLQIRLPDNRLGWVSSAFISSGLQIATLPEVAPATTPITSTAPVTGVGGLAQGVVVNANPLNVRSGPGLNFSPIATLPLNQAVTLEGRDAAGGWLQVRLPDNRLGWVSSAFISANLDIDTLPNVTPATTPITSTAPVTGVGGLAQGAVINANLLNVRSGPGLNFTVLATLPLGELVVLEGRDDAGAWLQIRLANGQLGWVSSAFITANLDIANLPVTG